MPDIPLPYRIVALMQERNRLFEYPLRDIEAMIRRYGFRCTRCGRCCTQRVNNHVFLLDHDVAVAREIDSGSVEPAPGPEFCDKTGMLYVSGYALKKKNDGSGSCWFLEGTGCRIYDRRFSVCRIYPYMLRQVSDASGEVRWQQFARPENHGDYHHPVPDTACHTLAREILEYENAFLTQQIAFLETVHEYFTIHGLRHDPEEYARQMQRFRCGEAVDIMVYYAGELEKHRITIPGNPMTAGGTGTDSS